MICLRRIMTGSEGKYKGWWKMDVVAIIAGINGDY